MQPDRIRRVLATKALLHSELARPLTWNSLRRVMRREDVELVVAPIVKPARLIGFDGVWSIAVSSRHPARRHTYYAAHEIGHLWLHVDDADGRHMRCYNFDDYTSPDPREDEAEQVAAWLLGDREVRAFLDVPELPTATLTAAPSMAALEAAILGKRIVSAASLTPAAPPEPPPPPAAKPREPDRFCEFVEQIADADSFMALEHLRGEIRREFANAARLRTLLREIDLQEEQLLEAQFRASRRRL